MKISFESCLFSKKKTTKNTCIQQKPADGAGGAFCPNIHF